MDVDEFIPFVYEMYKFKNRAPFYSPAALCRFEDDLRIFKRQTISTRRATYYRVLKPANNFLCIGAKSGYASAGAGEKKYPWVENGVNAQLDYLFMLFQQFEAYHRLNQNPPDIFPTKTDKTPDIVPWTEIEKKAFVLGMEEVKKIALNSKTLNTKDEAMKIAKDKPWPEFSKAGGHFIFNSKNRASSIIVDAKAIPQYEPVGFGEAKMERALAKAEQVLQASMSKALAKQNKSAGASSAKSASQAAAPKFTLPMTIYNPEAKSTAHFAEAGAPAYFTEGILKGVRRDAFKHAGCDADRVHDSTLVPKKKELEGDGEEAKKAKDKMAKVRDLEVQLAKALNAPNLPSQFNAWVEKKLAEPDQAAARAELFKINKWMRHLVSLYYKLNLSKYETEFTVKDLNARIEVANSALYRAQEYAKELST